jgi:HD-GYP domain-containing protein (c-di-GMP phosphodiesterase class II)
VVDVWDALRSERPYHPPWPEEKVREHLRSISGTHLDPSAVDLFLSMDW